MAITNVDPVLGQPGGASHHHPPAIHDALDSLTRGLARPLGPRESDRLLARLTHDRGGEHVARELVQRGGQAQQLLAVNGVEHDHPLDPWDPQRQRSGLVE